MRKFKILLILLFIIILAACSNTGNEDLYIPEITRIEGREGDALIWKVSSNTATVYLVGTIHVGLESLYPMQQVLLDAFYRSDVLAVEIDTIAIERSLQTQIRMAEMMILEDGSTIEAHVSSETFELFQKFIENKSLLEQQVLSSLRVGFAAMTLMQMQLEEWGFMDVPGVDHFFLEIAHEIGKEILEVESMEYQLGIIIGFSKALQELQLREILETPEEESRELMEKMLNMWINGDAEALRYLLETADNEFRQTNATLFIEYNTAMMLNRDIAMTESIIEMLSGNQTVFFAVGAAHIIGENGIIEQLENAGWTVTRVE